MGHKICYCEKCRQRLYPVYYRNKARMWKGILMKHIGNRLKRIYWCIKCKKFYRKNS